MTNSNILCVRDLEMNYGRKTALRGFNLNLPSGEIVGLLGANGSGKTTLMKIVAGLIQRYRGQVSILGQSDTWKTKEAICYYPSYPFFQPGKTIAWTLQLYASLFKYYDRELAHGLLRQFDFDPASRLDQLSKGRCSLALFILHLSRSARLYLLDEPFGGIDVRTRALMQEVLLNCAAPDRTYLISTHEISDMETLFDRIIVIKDGQVSIDENTDTLRQRYARSITELVKEVL